MTPERYQQVNRIFHDALERTREDRAGFLQSVCGDDHALRMEVERMLAAQEQAGSFLDSPAFVAIGHSTALDGQRHIGSLIGHYRILSKLGEGGMGEVLLAHDTVLERRVALKLLPDEFIADQDRVRRFEREARAASALNHPNIITIHEIGHAKTEAGDLHFIAQEYIEGKTLRRRIADGGLSLIDALDVAVQAASALQVAHNADIAHRDIKPENIMLRPDGIVKILDFGLAKLLAPKAKSPSDLDYSTFAQEMTTPGMILGTAVYMSPEQARGLEVDARSDIWSLGVVFYEMLTGRLPFKGATMSDVLVSILEREPPPLSRYLPGAPLEAERIVRKALAKNRDERYRAVNEMASDLKSLKHRLEFDAELARFSQVDTAPLPIAANLQTGEHVARQTLAEDRKLGTRAPSTSPRAMRIGAIFLIAFVACFFAWSHLRSKTASPPASTAPERQISYWLTVQRMRNGREFETSFESTGREIFESGWKFRLNFNGPQPGYIYLLNEGPTTGGAISYSLLFPSPSINNGSAQMTPNQPIQTGWYYLSEHKGTERLWLVWAAQAAPELEAAKGVFNAKDKGVISDQKMLNTVRELLNKQTQTKPEVNTDQINERTDVKFRAETLVQVIELEHR